jgi:8-oxo-dGTP pyrophosphatase MutT (NUDIX family)
VTNTNTAGLILLTYKGKVLLMHKEKSVIDEEKHPWCLIGGIRHPKESFEETLQRRVENETGIKIKNVEHVAELYYHAHLTDDNVNKMQRKEHQLLDFFTPRELNKLFLADSTQEFIAKHSNLISIL